MWQLVTYLFAYVVLHGAPASEVSENLSYQYYQVNAKAEQPLLAQLLAASPVREKDVTYVGNTTWNVQWQLDWKTNDNGVCMVTDSSTRLDVVIILPELHGGSELQREAFDRYLEALRRHELNHYRIAVEAARKIDTDLKSLPEMKSCKALEDYANAISRSTLERHNKKSREYDLETDHGQLEGRD
jgi:predicted secreted Zn-dependent protease